MRNPFPSSLPLWWSDLLIGVRSPFWPGMLVALTILGLLLAFHQVVRGAVLQGELRLQAVALHANATSRCNSMRNVRDSKTCLSQLAARELREVLAYK